MGKVIRNKAKIRRRTPVQEPLCDYILRRSRLLGGKLYRRESKGAIGAGLYNAAAQKIRDEVET